MCREIRSEQAVLRFDGKKAKADVGVFRHNGEKYIAIVIGKKLEIENITKHKSLQFEAEWAGVRDEYFLQIDRHVALVRKAITALCGGAKC